MAFSMLPTLPTGRTEISALVAPPAPEILSFPCCSWRHQDKRARCSPPSRPGSLTASTARPQQAVAERAEAVPAAQTQTQTQANWYACVANADFMLNDVQNESFAEQLRERRRLFSEKEKDIDFFLVSEPTWLDSKFPSEAKRVGRPCVALVSPDKIWMTFMKLRLDRVLMLDLGQMDAADVFKSGGPVPEFKKPEKWTAPYAPYAPGWWNVFMPSSQH